VGGPGQRTLWGRLARSARQVPLLLIGMMRPPLAGRPAALRRVAGDQGRMQLAGLAGRPWRTW